MMEGMFAYLLILASCYSLFIWLDVSHKLTSKANIFWKRVWLFGEGLYIRWVIAHVACDDDIDEEDEEEE